MKLNVISSSDTHMTWAERLWTYLGDASVLGDDRRSGYARVDDEGALELCRIRGRV